MLKIPMEKKSAESGTEIIHDMSIAWWRHTTYKYALSLRWSSERGIQREKERVRWRKWRRLWYWRTLSMRGFIFLLPSSLSLSFFFFSALLLPRFTPLTLDVPRSLIPIVNVPMIDYTIEFLSSNGTNFLSRIFLFFGFLSFLSF